MSELPLFFFQAEDGIRAAQESRGLGDVYKRQVILLGQEPWNRMLARGVEVPAREATPEDVANIQYLSLIHI